MPNPEHINYDDYVVIDVPMEKLPPREQRIRQIVEQKKTQLQKEGEILFERSKAQSRTGWESRTSFSTRHSLEE